jgi:hypothetical protein
MTIGDDIFTILGMVPIRDRAGIQRGTMADEAVKASGGNAEGQTLTQQGQAPPPLQLPPMGGPKPQGDVQLPDDVPTAYAAGKSKAALPAPIERTIAASPAANPSPAVRRGSDMIADEIIKRKRQEDMNGLFASIGLVASSLRGGGGDGSSRNALIEQAFGGGKATSVAEMIQLNNLRSSENEQAAKLAARQRSIEHAISGGMTRAEATNLADLGVLDEHYKPEALRKKKDEMTEDKIRKELEPQIDAYAAATGSDPGVLRAQLKISGGPQKLMDIMSPGSRADVREKESKAASSELDNISKAAKLKAWTEIISNPEAAKQLGLTPDDVAKYSANPEALNEFTSKFGSRSGEIAAGRGEATRGKVVDEYIKTDMPKVSKASNYLQTAQQIGDIWNDKAITGTLSGPIQSIARAYATFTNTPMPNLNDATAMTSLLQAGALDTLRALGGHDSDRDYERAMAIQGSTDMQAHEARGLHILNEKRARLDLQQANEKRDRYAAQNPQLAAEFDNLPRIPMPEPSKLLQADIYEPGEKYAARNAQLRTALIQYADQVKANPTPETISHYQKVAQRFDREYGPGLSGWYISNERKKAGGANGTAP